MLSLVLAASLTATPAPRAVTAADTVVHIPRLDALQGVTAFLSRASESAALLRPAAWFAELHPYLTLDPSQPDTLARVGVDPTGPLTVSLRAGARLTCMHLKNVDTFQEQAASALLANAQRKQQEVRPTTSGGVTTVSIPRESSSQAGYALKGKDVCSFASVGGGFVDDGQGQALLKEAIRLVSSTPKPDARLAPLSGSFYVLAPERGLSVGVDGTATELRLDGLATQLPLPSFQGGATSPYAALKSEGLLFSRARLTSSGVAQAVGSVSARIQQVCPTCPATTTTSVARAVAERLTGHVVWTVEGMAPRPNLRMPEGRFFAARQAFAAEVTDAAAMKAALAPLAKFPGARVLEDGWALDLKGGTLFLRQRERQLVVGNDEAVTGTLLAAIPAEGGKLPHAVDFIVDPKKLASALKQVSLMDVVSDKSMAGLFTLGIEMGPLWARSERISGWLDSTSGGHRFSATWTLPATP